MSNITEKTFATILAGFIKGQTKARDTLQALLGFGLEQYANHRNAAYLTAIVTKTRAVKSIPTVTVVDYIKAHANLKYVKLSDGTMGFKMDGDDPIVTNPEVTWYDWEGGKHNAVKADMDINAQVKALLTRINNAMKEGKVKDKEQAQKVQTALTGLLTTTPEQKVAA